LAWPILTELTAENPNDLNSFRCSPFPDKQSLFFFNGLPSIPRFYLKGAISAKIGGFMKAIHFADDFYVKFMLPAID
jgi:hypothetical protein